MDEPTAQEQQQWVYGVADALTETHQRYIESKVRRPASRSSNWASSLGHPCDLHLVFWRTQGEKAQEVSPSLQRIFEEGHKQESLILRELENMGIRVLEHGVPIHSQDTLFRSLNIHGQLDAKLELSVNGERKRVVCECKSLSPHLFDSIPDYDGLMTHKKHYVRAWGAQVQLYLLANNQEAGLLVLKNKSSGELRFIPITLDLETCEALAQKAKRVNEAVARYEKDQTLPPPIPWRQDVCAECPFLALCPNSREIPPTEISTDEELIELLERRDQLKAATAEAENVKERIHQKLEPFQGTNILVGDYQVRWSKVERPEKILPATSYWNKWITKLPGATETGIGKGRRTDNVVD